MSLLLARSYPALSSACYVSRCPSRLPLQCVKEFGSNTRGIATYTREQLALADSLREKTKKLRDGTPAGKKERLRTETNRVAYRALNKDDGKPLIDLHGMDVKGAEDKVAQKVAWASKIGLKVLMFIVGIGKHSKGQGVLKGRIRSFLRKRNHEVVTVNGGGILLVKLKS